MGFIRYAETMGKASVYEEMKDSFILSRMNDKSGENWLKSTNRMYKRWMMYVNNYDVKSTGTAAIDESKFFKNV